jgi:hypothetical protein
MRFKKCILVFTLFLSDFNETTNFSTDFRKIKNYQISRKFVQWESSCSTLTDRQTDRMTKLIVAFCNFARCLKRNAVLVFVKRWSAAIFSAGHANNNLDIKLKQALLYIWQSLLVFHLLQQQNS